MSKLPTKRIKTPTKKLNISSVDPVGILEEIAMDKSAGTTARVQAAKALIMMRGSASESDAGAFTTDRLTTRALSLMRPDKVAN